MAKSPKAVIIIQARRAILRSLEMVYPSGLIIRSLFHTVCAIDITYDQTLFHRDVVYLKEKGYIEFIDDVIGGAATFSDKTAKLTDEGLDIAQGLQIDPSLEI